MERDRPLVGTFDNDGVTCITIPPVGTTLRLLTGHFSIPDQLKLQEKKHPLSARFIEWLSTSIDTHKPPRKEINEVLTRFRNLKEQFQRDISLVMLSGSEPYKHETTRLWLNKTGLGNSFDQLLLNDGVGSSDWKVYQTTRFVIAGFVVVHMEDDLYAALRVAEIGRKFHQPVIVYLLRNVSNHPLLLRRAKITLPPNVHHVHSLNEAIDDLSDKLKQRLI